MKARFAPYSRDVSRAPSPRRAPRRTYRAEAGLTILETLTCVALAILAVPVTLMVALALAAPSMSPATLAAWHAIFARVFG